MDTIPADRARDTVIDAARAHVRRMTHTPGWQERLTPEAVALVEAVHEHDRQARR